jgi:hypothetical protein
MRYHCFDVNELHDQPETFLEDELELLELELLSSYSS